MKIKVKTLNSQTKEFEVEPDITIRQFKEIISPQISIDADVIRLIFKGRVLDDAAILNSCDIDNATIHAVERLPPNPTERDQPPTRTEPNTRTSANASIILGAVNNAAENYPSIAELVTQIVHNLSPSSGTTNQYSEFSNRLLLTDRFLDHIEYIFRNRFTNNTAITSEIRDYVTELRPPPITSAETTPSEESVVIRFSRTLRRYMNVVNTISPMINAYIYFLEFASNSQSNDSLPNFTALYPEFTDATSNSLHSLAHALHTLSDILVYSTSTNSQASTSAAPFSLVVPRLASDIVSTYHRHTDSRTPAASSSPAAAAPTNPAPQTATSSSATTQPTSAETSSNDSSSSVQVTFEVTSIYDSSGSRSTSNNNPSQYSAATSSNPTATANNSSSVPLLIRTTAGGGNSNSVRTTTTTNNARTTPRISHVSSRSSAPTTRRVRLIGDYTPAGPNEMPFDPYMACHSIHNTSSASTRIVQFGPISLNAAADSPQPSSSTTQTSAHPNTNSDTSNTPGTTTAAANANNPDVILTRERFVRRFLPSRVTAQRAAAPSATPTTTTTVNQQQPQPAPTTNSHTVENWSTAFPLDVVPIIQADVNSQTALRKQPPFSDGYVCGTCGKKKKLSEQDSSVQFINTNLSDAFVNNLSSSNIQADSTGIRSAIENNQELIHAYEENIGVSLQENLKKYKKIDPKKYPKAHELSKKK